MLFSLHDSCGSHVEKPLRSLSVITCFIREELTTVRSAAIPIILNRFFQLDLPCDTVVRLKRISEQCKFDFKCIELSDVFLSPDYIYRDISCAERAHSRQSLVFFCNLAYKTGLNNLLSGFHSNSYKAEIVSILRMRLLTLVAQSLGYLFH